VQLLFLKFGRDAESQSDRLGVEYSTKIGYDAKEMAGFFNTLDRLGEESGSGSVPTFLSTHPDPADRERKVAKETEQWQRKVPGKTFDVNREKYLRMIDGIVYGEDPKQGFVENNTFYHPVLKFQFPIPVQWQVQNSPQQVQMVDPQGKALMMLTLAEGTSLEAAAQAVMQQYQLTVVESRQGEVNNLPALMVVADQNPQQGQQGQAIRTLSTFIQYGGNIYLLLGASSRNDFNNYNQLFQNSMNGFSTLSDPEKLNRQPKHVRIKNVPGTGTLEQALTQLGVQQDMLKELSILNGMELSERVERGMLIKVVE